MIWLQFLATALVIVLAGMRLARYGAEHATSARAQEGGTTHEQQRIGHAGLGGFGERLHERGEGPRQSQCGGETGNGAGRR